LLPSLSRDNLLEDDMYPSVVQGDMRDDGELQPRGHEQYSSSAIDPTTSTADLSPIADISRGLTNTSSVEIDTHFHEPRPGVTSSPVNESVESVTDVALYQETLYNLGRAFQDMKLNHLAVQKYEEALELARRHPHLLAHTLHLTHESAHNLVGIYRSSGAIDMALFIMSEFLVFE